MEKGYKLELIEAERMKVMNMDRNRLLQNGVKQRAQNEYKQMLDFNSQFRQIERLVKHWNILSKGSYREKLPP